jgi:F-type H+-transporting ATPase subunit delta
LIGSDIAKRYARALFGIASEEDKIEAIYDELRSFSSLLKENASLMDFLANPVFERSDKKVVVSEILEKMGVSVVTSNFIKLLVDKRRIDALMQIEMCYQQYMDEVLNKARVHIKTAFALSDESLKKVKEKLVSYTGKNVEMVIDEDPSILGGVVVRVGDILYDGSIKTQLASIRELIREEI